MSTDISREGVRVWIRMQVHQVQSQNKEEQSTELVYFQNSGQRGRARVGVHSLIPRLPSF